MTAAEKVTAKRPRVFRPDSPQVDTVVPAVNIEPRRNGAKPRLLILHYTGMSSAEKAIDWLACAESKVSCHYVIAEDGRITQMVPERLRAWHAGVSYWRGETDINSHSIGIEIQNPGHADGYPDFPEAQMRAVVRLARCIIRRNRMHARDVLAHSDIAPERKIDPGEKFDWAFLARNGVAVHARPSPLRAADRPMALGARDVRVEEAQRLLAQIGYDAPLTGVLDDKTSKIMKAFQRRWRPRRIDGLLDRSTELTLQHIVPLLSHRELA